MPAEPPVNTSARNASCIFYTYTKGGLCKDVITSLYVFGNNDTLDYGERETEKFESLFSFFEISEKCKPIMKDLWCRSHFPPCDTTLENPRVRWICRRTFKYLDRVLCKDEMSDIRKVAATQATFDRDMINCSTYDVANGGDAPECYQYHPLAGNCIDISTQKG